MRNIYNLGEILPTLPEKMLLLCITAWTGPEDSP